MEGMQPEGEMGLGEEIGEGRWELQLLQELKEWRKDNKEQKEREEWRRKEREVSIKNVTAWSGKRLQQGHALYQELEALIQDFIRDSQEVEKKVPSILPTRAHN
ncbi:hypothetical protein BT69DRAFT_1295671 [Atractiella rhizophila]|nr:hypothetical protein BT69DRAFT_1295671 [Atractiella rhizophila]